MTSDLEFRSDLYHRLLLTWVGAATYWYTEPSGRTLAVVGAALVLAYLADRAMSEHEVTDR